MKTKIIFALVACILMAFAFSVYTVVGIESDASFISYISIVLDVLVMIFLSYYLVHEQRIQNEKIALLLSNKGLQAKAEMAEEVSKIKTDFLIRMNHELRTPLSTVIGYSDLLLSKADLPREMSENVTKIYDAGNMLLSLVNDMSDISKIENKEFELLPTDYDIPSLINGVVSLNMLRMKSRNIDFKLNVNENFPSRLFGDEHRVKQVFNNIFSNIFKYAVEGNINWNIDFERSRDNIWLVSRVEYSGISARKDLDFYKIEDPLGINAAKKIAEAMEGTIEEEDSDKSTLFSVRLKQRLRLGTPIGKDIADNLRNFDYSIIKRKKKANLVYTPMRYAKILMVDDMIVNLDVAQGLMQPYGIEIDMAVSGKIAIAKMMTQSVKYSAIFMDHMMPEMDGVETVRRIRELDSDYARNIPIIALTANALAGNDKMFLENGFDDFLSKPIDLMKLDSILKKWVMVKDK